jgi:hypothetical protein
VTVFPNGEVAYNNPLALPEGMLEPDYTNAARKLANQWSQDIAFTLDYMAQQNQDSTSPYFLSMDLDRVGAYGHSTGGGAAIQFCGTDQRCKAVLGMDPFMTPVSEQVLKNGLSQPAFFMFSQRWADDKGSKNNLLFRRFYQNFGPSTHVIGIQGTSHYDFSDLPMLSPIAPQLGLKGSIDGKLVTKIINTYMTIFFNQTLRGYPTDFFDGPSPYLEIINLDFLRDTVRPTQLRMSGGWEFHLAEGKIIDGKWTPQLAEWLVGTEISRWIALPWSIELETTLTTLMPDDQIELTMSNSDVLFFSVYSIQQMKLDELLALDLTSPSLLIVLFNDEDADGAFWVVTALP